MTSALRWLAPLCLALTFGCSSAVEPRGGIDGGGGGFTSDGALFGGDGAVSTGDGTGSDAASAGDTATGSDTGSDTGADTGTAADSATGSDAAVGDVGGGDGTCPRSCDDGVPCTLDVCKSGTCTHNLAPGTCYADGQCFTPGPAPGKNCLVCDPSKAQLALLPGAAGAACDDGSVCTGNDLCDAAGVCAGTPSAGCCKSDFDCVVTEPCQVGVCDVGSGQCSSKPAQGCCKAGVCCDTAIGAPKPSGTACGSAVVQTEWACDGADKRRRDAVAGCDGGSPDGCSTASQYVVWGGWQTAASCPTGQQCVPAAPGQEPGCGTPPECTKQADCNDGQPCTFDICDAGKCGHIPEKAGTPCGSATIATEYQCSSDNPGGAIQVRTGVAACDGQGSTCPTQSTTPAFGPWKTFKTCGWNDVCVVDDKSQPGVCKGAPKCKPGSICCDAAGEYAAKGTVCGEKEVDVEFVCEGTAPGNVVKKRVAKPGCSGNSTTCFEFSSSYWVWSEWSTVQTCGAKEACEISWSGEGSCTSKTQCSPSSGCCTADGFYAAQGASCTSSTTTAKSEKKCQDKEKGGWIMQRTAGYGCSGSSGSCSYSSENYVWSDWKQLEQCAKNEACDDSWGYVTCSSAGTCSPSGGCCDETGEYQAKGSKCDTSSSPWETEKKCDGSKIMVRKGWAGCSGSSGSCSYLSENVVWDEWQIDQDCGPDQVCKGSGFFYCGTP
ncbi:MAG: hypothetical protein H6747_10670 [Deltaproteobacteria bacterium]|nr:hypothetical protein [Deltaproteobacteria bacterium]